MPNPIVALPSAMMYLYMMYKYHVEIAFPSVGQLELAKRLIANLISQTFVYHLAPHFFYHVMSVCGSRHSKELLER